jgi:cell division protein FtsB
MAASEKRPVKYRIRWFRLAMLAVVGYCLYILAGQQLEMNALNREAEATRTRLEQLRQANQSLTEEKGRLTTPAYVEKLAREELGLVKPGEVPYIPVEKN